MSRYLVTPQARADLFEIWAYVAHQSSLDRADHVIHKPHKAMNKLAGMPGMGHVRDDLGDESLRVWPVYSYLVIYRPESTPLEIVRVLHGARDLRGIVGES